MSLQIRLREPEELGIGDLHATNFAEVRSLSAAQAAAPPLGQTRLLAEGHGGPQHPGQSPAALRIATGALCPRRNSVRLAPLHVSPVGTAAQVVERAALIDECAIGYVTRVGTLVLAPHVSSEKVYRNTDRIVVFASSS